MLTRRHFLGQCATAALAGPGLLHSFVNAEVSPRRPSASMWIYLWDLVDEGYDTVMTRLRDHNLTSISLATAYHAGKLLEPHNPSRKVVSSLLPGSDLTIGFQVGLPESGGKAEFLDRMRVAREHGVTSFNFYNYGLIPLKNLAWIAESLS